MTIFLWLVAFFFGMFAVVSGSLAHEKDDHRYYYVALIFLAMAFTAIRVMP